MTWGHCYDRRDIIRSRELGGSLYTIFRIEGKSIYLNIRDPDLQSCYLLFLLCVTIILQLPGIASAYFDVHIQRATYQTFVTLFLCIASHDVEIGCETLTNNKQLNMITYDNGIYGLRVSILQYREELHAIINSGNTDNSSQLNPLLLIYIYRCSSVSMDLRPTSRSLQPHFQRLVTFCFIPSWIFTLRTFSIIHVSTCTVIDKLYPYLS
jgi:hypothetical protein